MKHITENRQINQKKKYKKKNPINGNETNKKEKQTSKTRKKKM